MWVNLAAGALSFPTTTSPTADVGQRLALLRAAITELKNYRDTQIATNPSTRWNNAESRPSLVLVAPEYMFVRNGFNLSTLADLKKNRFLEKSDKDRLIGDLQRLSAEFGKQLVFVPGSIASREELPAIGADRNEKVELAKQHIKTAAMDMKPHLPTKTDDELMKWPTASPLGGKVAITPKQKVSKLEHSKTSASKYYLADNVAYLFTNGKAVGRYAKRGDFHERLPEASSRTIYVPGIAAGRATVGGINFGIEICLDHGLGTLKNAESVSGTAPSIHLVCSAEVQVEATNVNVREGGYFVHASSNVGYTLIARKRGANWEAPLNAQNGAVNGHTFRLGTIELDI